MKKVMTIFLAIFFVSILLAGCGSGVDEKNKEKGSNSKEVSSNTAVDTTKKYSNLTGIYDGTYMSPHGLAAVTLKVYKTETSTYEARFTFYQVKSNDPSGEYLMNVYYDETTGKYSLKGYQWLDLWSKDGSLSSMNYSFSNLVGKLSGNIFSGSVYNEKSKYLGEFSMGKRSAGTVSLSDIPISSNTFRISKDCSELTITSLDNITKKFSSSIISKVLVNYAQVGFFRIGKNYKTLSFTIFSKQQYFPHSIYNDKQIATIKFTDENDRVLYKTTLVKGQFKDITFDVTNVAKLMLWFSGYSNNGIYILDPNLKE